MNTLEKYGASERFLTEATLYPCLTMGRILSQYRDLYRVVGADGEFLAEVSGKFRHETKHISDFPVVGDFVMTDRGDDISGNAIIHHVLTRKSAFARSAAGQTNEVQVVAANIDTVFICMSLNNDYNLSRLERYLSIAWDSRATPVVILTKSDLCTDAEQKLLEVSPAAVGVDIITTSSLDEGSVKLLLPYLKEGRTASFIGSSGVGKSTLINLLAGHELLSTSGIRKDDRGRHTTTRRELILLPQGGMVIDTPGMRELGVDSADLGKSFSDIDGLSKKCRFRDCTHKSEPGCAVRQAIEAGELDERRFQNYLKLKKEARYDGLTSKQIETEKINEMFRAFGGMKNARKFIKEKEKRKY